MTENLPPESPRVARHRHAEARRRTLTVLRSDRLTPHMQRLTLTGDLEGFVSLAPDDHIKIILPDGEQATMRDYTPRRFDPAANELTVDFALHQAGPATAWALAAQVGDKVTIGGPRGSQVVQGPTDWLLIGDETALPAIGRRIEEAPAGTRLTVIAAIPDAADAQVFASAAQVALHWVQRPETAAADPAPLLDALRGMEIGATTYVWIAAEAGVARALRTHLLDQRGHPPHWLKAKGYWVHGKADATENFD